MIRYCVITVLCFNWKGNSNFNILTEHNATILSQINFHLFDI